MIRFIVVLTALIFGGMVLEHPELRRFGLIALLLAPVPAYLLGLSQHGRLRRLERFDRD